MVTAMQASLKVSCLNCGKEFLARRGTAKFCGANCRKAWARRGDKIDSEIDAILVALSNLTKYAEKWNDLESYIDNALTRRELLEPLHQANVRIKSRK